MQTFEIIVKNEEETKKIGKILSRILPFNRLLALNGDLAAGKTFLTRSILEELGYKHISSPSFSVMNTYKKEDGEYSLHIDAYRLEDLRELEYTGYDMLSADARLIIVEWAYMIQEILPDNTLYITLTNFNFDDSRKIEFRSNDVDLIKTIEEQLK